jgi:hypothetical protein
VAESSITADVAPARPARRPLLGKLQDLLSRLRAAHQARKLETIKRVRRLGLAHID